MAENFKKTPVTLFLFVDGLGLGERDPSVNPIYSGRYPVLEKLLSEEAVAIDPRLDTPGLPQSATGQATILTGKNAAAVLGRHVEGFPGPTLKELIRAHNIFSALQARGYRSTFANAYHVPGVEAVHALRRQSVTTVAALEAFNGVRMIPDLLAGQAVYQDITREVFKTRGVDVPTVTPEEAAGHLLDIARQWDFTLFEYFQTDLMAHKGTATEINRVLDRLNRFVKVLLSHPAGKNGLFILTSDHGNIEDGTHRLHTQNPVPFVALGHGADFLRSRVGRLQDIAPALLSLYPARSGAQNS